jgi:hypothetical protein
MNTLQQLHDRAALAIGPVALVLAQINIKPDKTKAPGAEAWKTSSTALPGTR